MRLVIWGCGTLGARVGRAWVQQGGSAIGITASTRRHGLLESYGVVPTVTTPQLQPSDQVLLATPGSKTLMPLVDQLSQTSPPERVVLSGSIRVNAILEQRFLEWTGDRGTILRFGGLWCEGRGPASALLRRGAPPLGHPDQLLALIHYDDAASVALAALRHPTPARRYQAITPPCPTRRHFYEFACAKLGLEEPKFDSNRPCRETDDDVTALRTDLLARPAFPDWRAAAVAV